MTGMQWIAAVRGIGRACLQGFVAAIFVAALAAALSPSAQARYPDRTITLIVPFAPGGPTDIIARVLGAALTQQLGQTIIIDNRAGASGNIGMGMAARATPDGYTLLLTSTAIAVNTALFKNLPYDPDRDFIPISELVNSPSVIVVRADSGIMSLADLVQRARAEPDKFNYASPGPGTKSHLTGELLKLRAGIQMVHVPFRGAGPAAQAVLARTTQVGAFALPPAEPLIKSGEFRALAVTGDKRWFSLPDVPTLIESGFPGFVSDTFSALFAPAGTPKEVVGRLVFEVQEAFKREDVRVAAQRAGFAIVAGTPEQLAARVNAEIALVKEVVTKAGIKTQ
jgi:tripartite-type tricarboxylate transporter receptor subunit TctC